MLTTHRRWGDFGLDIEDLKKRWARVAAGSSLAESSARSIELYAEQQGKPRWGDKTPGYTQHIRKISKVLPEARFIHLIRDGRDVDPLAHQDARAQGRADRQVGAALEEAPASGRSARARRSTTTSSSATRTLVTDPEKILRQICEFIELPFDEAMLSHHERSEERLSELDRDIPAMGGRLPRSAESRMALHERTTRAGGHQGDRQVANGDGARGRSPSSRGSPAIS